MKRRAETEWLFSLFPNHAACSFTYSCTYILLCIVFRFVEGDFDTYVSQIRKPHVWGGEPELFMASHVLQ
jgi:hypothetical protein